jgi:hypothetical protein
MRPRQGGRARLTSWPAWWPPSRASRPRSRRTSPRRPSQRPAWRTCACARPRCAPWAAGARDARRSCRPCCLACSVAGQVPAVADAPPNQRAGRAQVPEPLRRVGGGPADAAVLRLQHRALLLGRVPEGGLARRPQGRVPAPATRARLTGAAARQSRVEGVPGSSLCMHHVLCQASDCMQMSALTWGTSECAAGQERSGWPRGSIADVHD